MADAELLAAVVPPTAIIISSALTTLGGNHLDAASVEIGSAPLDRARAAFRRALVWWPSNGMALLNLADLERAHGSLASAMAWYEAAAALCPLVLDDVLEEQVEPVRVTANAHHVRKLLPNLAPCRRHICRIVGTHAYALLH